MSCALVYSWAGVAKDMSTSIEFEEFVHPYSFVFSVFGSVSETVFSGQSGLVSILLFTYVTFGVLNSTVLFTFLCFKLSVVSFLDCFALYHHLFRQAKYLSL